MKSLARYLLKTLCYADVFAYPLNEKEIYRYLIADKSFSVLQVHKSLQFLLNHQHISQVTSPGRVGGCTIFYTLPGREQTISNRYTNFHESLVKRKKTRNIAKYLIVIPTIQAIYITGSLAVNNADQQDDIDLMIITSYRTLWITRLIISLFLSLLGLRRSPHTLNNTNKLCLNLFLDESALAVPEANRNLYIAHEVAQAQPLFQKNHLHLRFLNENKWITTYLPHTPLPTIHHQPTTTTFFYKLIIYLIQPLEFLAYKLQTWYMKPRQTQEKITPYSAFFHPRNTNQIILNQYHSKLSQLKS